MFTGIVKEVGTVESINKSSSLTKLGIKAKDIYKEAQVSDSIAVNGTCLTLIYKDKDILYFEAVNPTLEKTNLKRLKKGDFVNLESALKAGDKMGGHFVLGHVDCEGKLKRTIKKTQFWQMEVEVLSKDIKFLVENGSVALDGISLTVKRVAGRSFTVDIIPFTYEHTILKNKKPGSWLNIEFDYLLKQKK